MILTITEISSIVKIVNHTYATLLGPITPHAANLGLIMHHADNLGPITNKGNIPLCHLVIAAFFDYHTNLDSLDSNSFNGVFY